MKHALTLHTALLLAPLASSQSGPAAGTKRRLAFGDEFDGKAIDEAKWKPSDYRKWDHPGLKTRLAKENCALDVPAKDEVRR